MPGFKDGGKSRHKTRDTVALEAGIQQTPYLAVGQQDLTGAIGAPANGLHLYANYSRILTNETEFSLQHYIQTELGNI